VEVLPGVVRVMTWLDKLPGGEKQKIQERFRMSPAAYEKMRENVKGPEDLEKEQARNEAMAQLKFTLETEPEVQKALAEQIASDIESGGLESVIENTELPQETKDQLEKGEFEVSIDAPDENAHDQIVLVPEGNVNEKIPISFSLSETYVSQLGEN
jgi:hypothetical protein